MEKLFRFLNSVHTLSKELEDHLLQIVKEKHLARNEFLLRAGHVSSLMCFIGKGMLRAFYTKGETEVSSWFMKEGDIIVSIESFYDRKESYESIQALEDSSIFYVSYQELEHVYRTYPEFNFIGRVLTIQYLKFWTRQLYSIRSQSAQERYEWLMLNNPEIISRVPSKYLASYLDITPETLSRIKGNVSKRRS
jgi:CRP-like cAMP-binding protein